MTRDRAVGNFRGSFPDRDGIWDLTARVLEDTRVLRATHAPLGSQVVQQLFFQHSTRLDEQATVNGLVGHTHPLVLGILRLQPSGNLLGRPVQDQFTRNHLSQPRVQGKKALLRPQSRLPGVVICLMRPIAGTATMAGDLPAHRRSRSIQVSGDLAQRLPGLPTTPDFVLLDRRKSKPFPWPHITPPLESSLIPDGVASTC